MSIKIPQRDAEQRKQALDPCSSFIVQAPAGSGKTELLTQRFLLLLSRVQRVPEEIIAITFTRKAAAEMQNRVASALRLALDDNPPEAIHKHVTWSLAKAVLERDKQFEWNLIDNPNRLRIYTFDALCSMLTQQLPILSRFGAQPSIADDPYSLYQQAAQILLANLNEESSWVGALMTILLHLDNDFTKAEALFAKLLANRDQWLEYILDAKHSNQPRETFEKMLGNINQHYLHRIQAHFPIEYQHQLCFLLSYIAENNPEDATLTQFKAIITLPPYDVAHLNEWLAIAKLLISNNNNTFTWKKARALNKNHGFPAASSTNDHSKKSLYEAMKQQMGEILSDLESHEELRNAFQNLLTAPPSHYTDQQWLMVAALIEFLPILAAQLQLVFKEQGKVDFIEVAQSALRALGELDSPTDLTLALDYQIQHILVDEFQDTSINQYRLLERLTAGWQDGDGRSLFLVGDPMQSIYRFRKAEVGLFLRARHEGIGSIKLTSLHLSTNFRSDSGIVNWINSVFTEVFPTHEDLSIGAVTFSPCEASDSSESNKDTDEEANEMHLTTDSLVSRDTSTVIQQMLFDKDDQIEAERVVDIIKNTWNDSPNHSIAILVKARTHLFDIITQLKLADIPYHAVEIDPLGQRPMIRDLLALTRALHHRGDKLSWLTIFRAPWCGLSLIDLHALAGGEQCQILWENVMRASELPISAEGQQRIARLLNVLKSSIANRYRRPLSQWIHGTWLAINGPACAETENDLKDARAYFDLLLKIEDEYSEDIISTIENRLAKLYSDSPASTKNAVEIMTIHKAKGLEFDTVIIPCLHRSPRRDDQPLLLWMEQPSEEGIDLLLAPISAISQPRDSIYQYLRLQEKKKSKLETCRLLYVACTRARHKLFLLGQVFTKVNPDIQTDELLPVKQTILYEKPATDSLLAELWEQLSTT
jgi:ATP-dependent helicase/nuclease subunit A